MNVEERPKSKNEDNRADILRLLAGRESETKTTKD